MNGITTYQNGLGIDDKLRSKNRRTVRYFLTDHLGSTEALANASGAIVSSTSYDSFGNATSNIATSYRYTGREYDADTGLYYYRNRWYDPEIGRFISTDPIGFAGGDINLYGYVGNNPYGYIDPYGFWRCAPSDPLGWLDAVQLALSAAGMVNVVGEVFDVVNAGISVARGNYSDAALDASSAIPFIGNITGAGKLASRLNKVTRGGKFWTKSTTFKNIKVFQRNDLINPKLVDTKGRTNLQRMQKGLAPIGPDGKSINLHHMTQTNSSGIAEVTQTFHKTNHSTIHINPNTIPSGINRSRFNSWKRSYWVNRAKDF